MKLTEMQKRMFELKKRSDEIADAVEARGMKFTDEELVEMESINKELRGYAALEERKRNNHQVAQQETIHEMCEEFRAMMRGERKEMDINLRAAVTAMNTSTTAAAQTSFVEGVLAPLSGTIHKLVGTKIRTNMKVGGKWVIPGNVTAKINGEAVKEVAQQIPLDQLNTSPKRVSIQVNASNQAVEYSDVDLVNEVILPAIQNAIEQIVNLWMFSTTAIAGSNGGAFVGTKNTVTAAAATPTYKDIQKLVGTIRKNKVKNDGTFAFVMSSMMAADLRATSRDAGSGRMIIENDAIDGIPVFETEDIENGNTGVPKYIGFGRYSDYLIGQFGNVRFRVDDSSADVASADLIYWTVNMDMDQKVLRPEAFGLLTTKTA